MAAGAPVGAPGRPPPQGRDSPAAELLLSKFEELYAEHKTLAKTSEQLARVQAENEELRVRIRHLTAHEELRNRTSQDSRGPEGFLDGPRAFPVTEELTPRPKQEVAPPVPSLVASPKASMGTSLKDLRDRLASSGVGLTDEEADDACLDLHAELLRRECSLEMEGGGLTLRRERVEVLVQAEVGGETRCLLELASSAPDGFQELEQLRPLRCALLEGEDWRQAAQRLLQELFALEPAWQDRQLRLEEESCGPPVSARQMKQLPRLQKAELLHKVKCRVQLRGPPEEELPPVDGQAGDECLERLGLPRGDDFCTTDTDLHGLPVRRSWRWSPLSDRESGSELESGLAEFEGYLAALGVDVSKFGSGSMKSLHMLYTEVKEQQLSHLRELPAAEVRDGGPRLLRVCEILILNLEVEVNGRLRALQSPKQYLDDGRESSEKRNLVAKVRPGESWRDALPRALGTLGISQEARDLCFQQMESREKHSEDIKWSKGYPLRTQYITHDVTVVVTDPGFEDLEIIGLPEGHDFVSKEGQLGAKQGGRLHVWTWEPVQESTQNLFEGTPYEGLAKYLADIRNIVQQVEGQDNVRALGMKAPLDQVLDKVQKCLDTVVNIDQAQEVDVRAMLQKGGRRTTEDGPNSTGPHQPQMESTELADFISSNYTRKTHQSGTQNSRGSRRSSLAGLGGLFSLNLAEQEEEEEEASSGVGDADAAELPWMTMIKKGKNSWGLDFFGVSEACSKSPLQSYGRVHFVPFCTRDLMCAEEQALEFLDAAAKAYYDNPYHNAMHAAQVMHTSLWLTDATGLCVYQSAPERAALMIAAICHDVKHFGRNNAFCMSSKHHVSLVYNDRSVLENMSSHLCFQILYEDNDRRNVLNTLSDQDQAMARSMIIELILATDMLEHFDMISKFRVRRIQDNLKLEEEADRRVVTKMCLKAGDVSHAALPWELHTRWSALVTQEFMEQGDEERQLGLPVSPLCNRDNLEELGKSQRGFLEFVCMPLFEELGAFQKDWELVNKELASPSAMDGRASMASSSPSSPRSFAVDKRPSHDSGRSTGANSTGVRSTGANSTGVGTTSSPNPHVRSRRGSICRRSGPGGRSPLARSLSLKIAERSEAQDIQSACILRLKENAEKWVSAEQQETVSRIIEQIGRTPPAKPATKA